MKRTKITLAILILLTIVSAIIAQSTSDYKKSIILILASLKFIGIAYIFMDLYKAHPIWKIAVITYVILIVGTVLILN